MRRAILGCEPNGFGPVSKLTAAARLLEGVERIFVGDNGAYDFAQCNASCFERFLTIDEFRQESGLIESCDFGVVVMEPDLTFELLRSGMPVYYFDSLIEFWVLPNGLAPLAKAATEILSRPLPEGRRIFDSFSIHERKVLAHMLATRSFAQNFPGVPQRLAELRACGFGNVILLGSIIDAPPRAQPIPARSERDSSWSMLINLGGVQNFAIRFNKNDYAIDLIELWAEKFLAEESNCEAIVICCGRYSAPDTRLVGDRRLTRQFLPHDEFMVLLESADIVVSAAGRTTLAEAVHLGRLPILLPEQHHNQYCNIRSLAHTEVGRLAVRLGDVMDMGDLPDDDFEGTRLIIDCTRRVLQCEKLFTRFDLLLRNRIERIRAFPPAEHQRMIDEVAQYMSGQDFASAVRALVRPSVSHAQPPGQMTSDV